MQPTRGLDVGAIEGVQRLLLAQREAGAAILLSRKNWKKSCLERPHRGDVRRRDRGRSDGARSGDDRADDDRREATVGRSEVKEPRTPSPMDLVHCRRLAAQLRWPFTMRIEPRLNVPRWLRACGLGRGDRCGAASGRGRASDWSAAIPWQAYAHIGQAAFGDLGVFSDTLVKATPLILVGLACSVAFRMKLWNIGAEGQFYMGALGASAVILSGLVPETASRPVTICGDAAGRDALRRGLGLHPRLAQGQAQGQRDHHHPDDELHCRRAGQLLCLRRVERRRLSDEPTFQKARLAAASGRLRQTIHGVSRPDHALRSGLCA